MPHDIYPCVYCIALGFWSNYICFWSIQDPIEIIFKTQCSAMNICVNDTWQISFTNSIWRCGFKGKNVLNCIFEKKCSSFCSAVTNHTNQIWFVKRAYLEKKLDDCDDHWLCVVKQSRLTEEAKNFQMTILRLVTSFNFFDKCNLKTILNGTQVHKTTQNSTFKFLLWYYVKEIDLLSPFLQGYV